MKTWRNGGIAPQFLVSALDGGDCSASRPCHFTFGGRALGTHRIGGLSKSVLFHNGYGLGDGQGFDSCQEQRVFCSPPPTFCPVSNVDCFHRDKATGAWNIPAHIMAWILITAYVKHAVPGSNTTWQSRSRSFVRKPKHTSHAFRVICS
jgi:hypothetical protein